MPLLGLLNGSLDLASPSVILWPMTIAVMVALVTWVLLVCIARNGHTAALAATLLVAAAFSYRPAERFALSSGLAGVLPLVGLGVLFLAVLILRVKRREREWTAFANQVSAMTLLFLMFPLLNHEWQRTTLAVNPLQLTVSAGPADLPNVYVLILDGYGREDVLREVYSFENSLIEDLRALGFVVADEAAANYAQTALSLGSALNLDYLSALTAEDLTEAGRRGLGDLIKSSRFFAAFAAAGYDIRAYASEYSIIRTRHATERPAPFPFIDQFGYAVYESTVLPPLFEAARLPRGWLPLALHRRQLRWTLTHLESSVPDDRDGPALVFAHLLAPHPPFSFNADGTDRSTALPALFGDGDHWHRIATGTGESYHKGYVDSVRFLNARLLKVVHSVLSRSRRPTIFLIQADHGPGSGLKWEDPDRSDVRERLGILLAMKFPDCEQPPINARTTPVNAFRAIVNRALGASLVSLEDRSYFQTWRQPFVDIDVTERVRPHDPLDGIPQRPGSFGDRTGNCSTARP